MKTCRTLLIALGCVSTSLGAEVTTDTRQKNIQFSNALDGLVMSFEALVEQFQDLGATLPMRAESMDVPRFDEPPPANTRTTKKLKDLAGKFQDIAEAFGKHGDFEKTESSLALSSKIEGSPALHSARSLQGSSVTETLPTEGAPDYVSQECAADCSSGCQFRFREPGKVTFDECVEACRYKKGCVAIEWGKGTYAGVCNLEVSEDGCESSDQRSAHSKIDIYLLAPAFRSWAIPCSRFDGCLGCRDGPVAVPDAQTEGIADGGGHCIPSGDACVDFYTRQTCSSNSTACPTDPREGLEAEYLQPLWFQKCVDQRRKIVMGPSGCAGRPNATGMCADQ